MSEAKGKRRWQRPTQNFIVLCGSVVGGGELPFEVVYSFDGEKFDNRRAAIEHGLKTRGSDDFNIGVVEGKKLVSIDWMEEPVDSDPTLLREVAAQIMLEPHP